jgi:cell division protein FtsI (penicillin-binding protein 3)
MVSRDRLHVPPLPVPVDPPGMVRAGAERRARMLGFLLMGMISLVAFRGIQLCLVPAEKTVRAGSVQRWDQVTLRAKRGEIYDRNGRRLATSVETPNIIVDPLHIADGELAPLAGEVAELLGRPVDEIARKMSRDTRYSRLATKVHPRTVAAIKALGHRSLWAERDSKRYYPEGRLAAQIIGFVDSSGSGRAGMEAHLDGYLRGGAILFQRRRDRRGLDVDRSSAVGAFANVGMNVHTTIDRTIQHITEVALAGVLERHEPVWVTAVVVDVASGDILALANAPTFNPNELGPDAAPRRNHAVQDAVEPGSVFKPFTVAAAIEAGLVSETTMMNCEGGSWQIGRTRIRDDHPHKLISVSDVIKYSSNICSAKLALELGAQSFLAAMKEFGFGERSGIPLPGERQGFLRPADTIKPIELATTSYGQGATVTTIQLAMATATLANGGVRMRPRLVTRVEDVHGVPELVQQPTEIRRVVSEATAHAVTRMMTTVTEPGGTGTRARVKGYSVAGKTGTAEKVRDGRYSDARIGSFIGYLPASNPKIAIAITVDEPQKGSHYGGVVAGPAFSEIGAGVMRYLGIPPDMPGEVDASEPAVILPEEAPPEAPILMAQMTTMPDFRGRTMRNVLASVQGSGVNLQLEGSGRVVNQEPAPGTAISFGMPLSFVFK